MTTGSKSGETANVNKNEWFQSLLKRLIPIIYWLHETWYYTKAEVFVLS